MNDKIKLRQVLSDIGKHLKQNTTLTVIGSTVGILSNQYARMTEDVDVWYKSSIFDDHDLQTACKKANVGFNPLSINVTNEMYLQIIQCGIVQVGEFNEDVKIELARFGNLIVSCPPIENVIASKMIRCSDDDIEDIVFLSGAFRISMNQVETVIGTFPDLQRQEAMENIPVIQVCLGQNVVITPFS